MRNVYYLDDDNNIVSKDKATNVIVSEYDEDGNLISETHAIPESHLRVEPVEDSIELSDEAQAFVEQFVKEHKEAMEAKRK